MRNKITVLCILFLMFLKFDPSAAQYINNGLFEGDYGEVHFVTGGITMEERNALTSRDKDFNLKLVFKRNDESYLNKVDVLILGETGEWVFAILATGPIVMLKVPAGKYHIKADCDGVIKESRVQVANGRIDKVMIW